MNEFFALVLLSVTHVCYLCAWKFGKSKLRIFHYQFQVMILLDSYSVRLTLQANLVNKTIPK